MPIQTIAPSVNAHSPRPLNYVLAAMLAGVKEQDLDIGYQVSDAKGAAELGKLVAYASNILYNSNSDQIQKDLAKIKEYADLIAAKPGSSDVPGWQAKLAEWNAKYGADSAAASNFVNNGQTNLVQPLTTEAQQDASNIANSGQFVSSVLSSMQTLTTILSQALA